jgi:c-di-GMP-related signal transduction protein
MPHLSETVVQKPLVTPASDCMTQIAIARQSILDAKHNVFAYELFDRSRSFHFHTAASDAEMLFNLLSHIEYEALVEEKVLFINCTHDSLAGGHLDLIQPDRVVLEIPTLDGHPSDEIEARLETLMNIRRRGFRLSFSHAVLAKQYASWLPQADFIKFDLSQIKAEQMMPMVNMATKNPSIKLIAEKVETAEQFEFAASHGIQLFQGYWFAKPVLVTGQTLRPSQAHIIQLINLIRQQATTIEIEEVLKRDPTLSFNLLRFINSAGFGLDRQISSFRHAVMMMGLSKLFRWAALLLTTSPSGGIPSAVGEMAVVRGRLMELLAAEALPAEETDNAFVVGIFSLLDTLLGLPMEKALESIALPEAVTQTLLHRKGLFAPFLELTEACETVNEEAFARCANLLQLSNHQVNMAHLQALIWAESIAAEAASTERLDS